jgi:hypothetical protein
MHLILAYAATLRHPEAVARLQLPHLQRALTLLQATPSVPLEEDTPWLAHEAAHAQALGWPAQGPWPWAAWATHSTNALPQAWISPAHWQLGMDQALMHPTEQLGLTQAQAQALLDSLQAFLQEDGLQVQLHTPTLWHAQGAVLADIHCASLERMAGAQVKPWLTPESLPAPLRRLQSEAQMLLYHHPVNDERAAQGLPAINALWFHGAGSPQPTPGADTTRCIQDLYAPSLAHTPAAWVEAWHTLDATVLREFADTLERTGQGQLTLCSEHTCQNWQTTQPTPWWQVWRRKPRTASATALQRLLTP